MADDVKRYAMIFPDQRQFVKLLSREQKGDLFDAIFDYLAGETPQFEDQVLQVVFLVFKQAIDRGMEISVARQKARKGKKQEQNETNDNKTNQTETTENETEQNAYNKTRTIQEQNNTIKEKDNIPPLIPPKGECDKKETIKSVLDEQPEELRKPLEEFIKHRKQQRKPPTAHALRLCIERLQELAPDNIERQIELIDYAIAKGWIYFYPPTENQRPGTVQNEHQIDFSFMHEVGHE